MINENENNNNNLRMLEVNEEIESLKKSKETRAYILFVFTQIIWTIQGLQLKSFFSLYSSIYDLNSLVFWRHLAVSITGYLSIRYKNINFKYPSQIQNKKWFYIRNVGIYVCIYTWMKALSIFRLSTCQILGGVTPLMTIIYSIIFLKEKFYTIYLIGIIICFTGSLIIILNERKLEISSVDKNNKNNSYDNYFIGILSLVINVNLFSPRDLLPKA
jgi:drug/metabolite transporter (DMT)-like permease